MRGIGEVEMESAAPAPSPRPAPVPIDIRRPDGFPPLAHLPATIFAAAAFVLYLAGAGLSDIWTDRIGPTPLAASTGLVVGLMFVSPRRTWPAALAALAFASVVYDTAVLDGSIGDVAVLALARVIGTIAVVAIYAWVFSTAPVSFEVRSVISVVAPVLALLIPATLVAVTFDDATTSRSLVWATWAVGETMGILVFAPLFTALMTPFPQETMRHLRSHAPEAIVVVALVVSVTIIGYTSTTPLVLLIIPTLAWLAYSSSNFVAAPAAAFVVVYGTIITHAGEGPFARFVHPLLWLQLIHAVALFFVIALGRAFWHDRWGVIRYQAILALQPDALSIHDVSGQPVETLAEPREDVSLGPAEIAERWVELTSDGLPSSHVIEVGARTLEVRLSPVSGLVLVVVRDVTEQRRAVAELEDAESRWKRLAETAFEGFIEVGPDFTVTYVSDRWAAMFGMDPADIVGRTFAAVLGDDNTEQLAQHQPQVLAGEHFTFEYAYTRADGERRWALVSAEGKLDADGRFAGFVSFAADTTELHQAVAAREAAELLLANVEQRERERIAGMLHDGALQTMVALGYRLNMIKTGADPRELAEQLESMAMTAVREMRDGLTALTPIRVTDGDIGRALQQVAERVARPDSPELVVDDRLDGRIDMDSATTLFLIGREAVINASAHADATRIRVTLSEADRGYRLDVADDGIGMNGGQQQVDGHLGIRLMTHRANEAGGRFEIAAARPRGTCVSVWIPGSRESTSVAQSVATPTGAER